MSAPPVPPFAAGGGPGPAGFGLPAPGALVALNRLCRRFIGASVVYLVLGMLLALLNVSGLLFVPRQVHAHVELVGFVAFLIFGVGYKLLPTMFGGKHGIHSQGLADLHFWLANPGLWLMAAGMWGGMAAGGGAWRWVLLAGGLLQVAGALLFAYNLLRAMR